MPSPKTILSFFALYLSLQQLKAQTTIRPMIWVKPSDKAAILEKINKHDWAKQSFETLKSRVSTNLQLHQNNPKEFLSKMPLDWTKKQANQFPHLQALNPSTGVNNAKREVMMEYLQTGIDCGILYFLTDEEKYDQFGAD